MDTKKLLKNISEDTLYLCKSGKWGLWEIEYAVDPIVKYMISTEPYSVCCNPHGVQKFYLFDGNFNHVGDEALLSNDGIKYVKHISLSEVKLKREERESEYFKMFGSHYHR